jgi:hypothetical protein
VASWLNVRPSIFMVRPLIFRESEHSTFSVLFVEQIMDYLVHQMVHLDRDWYAKKQSRVQQAYDSWRV